jgi:hypothetical protein
MPMPAWVVARRVTSSRWPAWIGGQGDGIALEQTKMPRRLAPLWAPPRASGAGSDLAPTQSVAAARDSLGGPLPPATVRAGWGRPPVPPRTAS